MTENVQDSGEQLLLETGKELQLLPQNKAELVPQRPAPHQDSVKYFFKIPHYQTTFLQIRHVESRDHLTFCGTKASPTNTLFQPFDLRMTWLKSSVGQLGMNFCPKTKGWPCSWQIVNLRGICFRHP